MSYPSQRELLQLGRTTTWLDMHFFRPDPFGFKKYDFREFAAEVAAQLDVEANGVFCVGSGATGLSLNPKNIRRRKLAAFDDNSDLDIAIISSRHFEQGWRDLRVATSPALDEIDPEIRRHLGWQRSRLFDGAIIANVLLGKLTFGDEWLEAITRLENELLKNEKKDRDLNIWIYRDYWSLRYATMRSVKACAGKVDV